MAIRPELGDNTGFLFVRPRPGSSTALVGVVGGTGPSGMRLTNRLRYFWSGVSYPDLLILGPRSLQLGDRAVRAGLDYLALGDWHGVRQAGPKAWYAGTPEPDRFRDNAPGHALAVRIAAAGAEPEVERHRLAQYRWQRHTLDGDVMAALAAVEGQVAAAGAEAAAMLDTRYSRARRSGLSSSIEYHPASRITHLPNSALSVEIRARTCV